MIKIIFNDKGQAVVEAALIIPALMFLMMGIFVVGYWLNAQQVVTAAAREGARAGALTGDRDEIGKIVASVMQTIDTDQNRINVEAPDPLPAVGNDLVVKVTYQIPLGFSFFKSEYESSNSAPYPFSQAVGQAVSRMEVSPE